LRKIVSQPNAGELSLGSVAPGNPKRAGLRRDGSGGDSRVHGPDPLDVSNCPGLRCAAGRGGVQAPARHAVCEVTLINVQHSTRHAPGCLKLRIALFWQPMTSLRCSLAVLGLLLAPIAQAQGTWLSLSPGTARCQVSD